MIYNIRPINVTIGTSTKKATNIGFQTSYTPFTTSMTFNWTLSADNGEILYSGDDVLGEDVLTNWGTDDMYLGNAMASKVGVTLVQNIVESHGKSVGFYIT